MKASLVPVLLMGLTPYAAWVPAARAQGAPSQTPPPAAVRAPAPGAPAPATAPSAAGQSIDDSSDRFGPLREAADALKSAYEQLDTKNMQEVDSLLRTKRCQINRIGGDLDRVLDAMRLWLEAETKYWKAWSEVEQKRIDSQTKTLASMEEDQKRAAEMVESEKQSREELERRKAGLESGKRTQEIVAQIDGIIKDIQDSEEHLASAQKDFDELTVKITDMKASISARVVDMRQNTARLDAFGLDMTAYYEKNRNAANEICNTKQPDTPRTPLPKRGSQ
jgi:chromosome segregation ATPase